MPKIEQLSASLEDYLEAIFNIIAKSDVARSKDIALALNVAKPSVTSALRVLKDKQLVNYKPYGYVTLTPAGQNAAMRVVHKHNVLTSFFTEVLGVEDSAAQTAACQAEHDLGSDVISRLLLFMEFTTSEKSPGHEMVGEFREYCSQKSVINK
jgi:DtxR family Mn-dependent transcriptional regulator